VPKKPGSNVLAACSECRVGGLTGTGDYTPEFKHLGDVNRAQQIAKPFSGADAHPDKHGGELCVEGTSIPVSLILTELAKRGVDIPPNLGLIAKNLALDFSLPQRCLRGLADWLKTQDWVGRQTARWVGTETGCWAVGDELVAFRLMNAYGRLAIIEEQLRHQEAKLRLHTSQRDLWEKRARDLGYSDAAETDVVGLETQAVAGMPPEHRIDPVVELTEEGYRKVLAAIADAKVDVEGRIALRCPKCNTVFNVSQNKFSPHVACPGCRHDWVEVSLLAYASREERSVVAQEAAQAVVEKQRAAQAGGGFMCPKCKTVFLDTGFPRLPGGRDDEGPSGWHVTCPECKHEWNCLNHKPSITDRLADLEKDVRQLFTVQENREIEAVEKRCGMCGVWIKYGGECGGFFLRVGIMDARTPTNVVAKDHDGPPWENCRFWKPVPKEST